MDNKFNAPESMTKDGIISHLRSIGCKGIMDTKALEEILPNISSRTIRSHINMGNLKAVKSGRTFVFTIENLAEFFQRHPRYIIAHNVNGNDMDNNSAIEFAELTKKIINSSWRSLLKYEGMDDLVSEVMVKYVTARKTTMKDSSFIFKKLCDIDRRIKRRIQTVNVENIEAMTDMDEDEINENSTY